MTREILRRNFGPLMLEHIIKDERVREYRGIDDTIEACREDMACQENEWNWESGYYDYPTMTFRDYEN